MWLALYTWVTDVEDEWESMRTWFARTDAATFVAVDPDHRDTLVGYADVGERSVVDGCESSPTAFLEAWFVKEEWRRKGIGDALSARPVQTSSQSVLPRRRKQNLDNS